MKVCLSYFLKLIALLRLLASFGLVYASYSLSDPRVRPRTSCFCTSRMKMKLGTTADVPSAEMNPHSDPVDVTKVDILTGSVRIEFVRKRESRNSVHAKMKQSTAVAATPPVTNGSTTLRKIWNRVAPSIMAASSTSTGTSSKKDFISSTATGRLMRVSMSTRP